MRHGCAALLAAALLSSFSAQADEQLFGYVYGTDTLPKGETEVQASITHRWGKARGHYAADDFQLEVEHGITDKLAVAGYLLGLKIDHKGAFPTAVNDPLDPLDDDVLYPDRKGAFFRGIKTQLKYNVMSPYAEGGFGLSFFVEPSYITRFRVDGSKTKQIEIEVGALAQKNFFNDKLVIAANTIVARERRTLVEDDDFVEHEIEFYQLLGATYRIANNFYAGLEARHHMDVLKNEEGDYKKNQYSFFIGPTLHYATKAWWMTMTYFRQIQGGPTYAKSVGPIVDPVDSDLHLDENEKNEVRLRFGMDF
ncbi:DUF6662 family protein [Perlucidibaca aquatica]|uniref:DUF6662 family protein n=1 Tax=Perlucidibaca aquatica TaxID=1852776 RepID=UPI00083A6048|nr:DUF6662 family protein [Perlucidibaca aquatica]